MTAADKLIADRGHGMSRAQRAALTWVATQGLHGAPPKRDATWQNLLRLGLVTYDRDRLELAGMQLTRSGRTLLDRMGVDKP